MTVVSLHNVETEYNKTDNVNCESWFHENGDIVCILIIKRLVEVDADHDKEGEDKEESDSCYWMGWSDS